MVGTCPRCGKEFMRPAECDTAACDCESAVEVPLKPALIFPLRVYKRLQKAAEAAGVTIEGLVNAILEIGLEKFIERLPDRSGLRLTLTRNQEAT